MIYLVFITDDREHCLEVYPTHEMAERAVAHYKRRGYKNARIEARAIRDAAYLSMIGA